MPAPPPPGPPPPAPPFVGFRVYVHGDPYPAHDSGQRAEAPTETDLAWLRSAAFDFAREESKRLEAHRFELRGVRPGGRYEKSLAAFVAGEEVAVA
jgi:hypothetical protein